jgi:hypothetical protein
VKEGAWQKVSLTFVVSTGRCGSTMLSLIMREHPDVLSLSEFFTGLKAVRRSSTVPGWDMDGAEFWQILATPLPASEDPPERWRNEQGPRYLPGSGRFDPAAGVPIIARTVLPTLTDDPDSLFDLLAAEVPGWQKRPAADHYRSLFGLLARALGRTVVVERSGGSLPQVTALHTMFPEARFVHMHRDGPDCALSMSKRPAARRTALFAEAARAAGLPPGASFQQIQAAMPARFKDLLTPPFNIQALMDYPLPLASFAQRWSEMVCNGVAALRQLAPGTWTSVSYENLLARPEAELARLARFIGITAPESWLAAARQIADPSRPGAVASLPPADRAALREACQPGADAIRAAEAELAGAAVTPALP